MLMLERYRKYLQFLAIITLGVFLPSSVEAWNYLPMYTVVEVAGIGADEAGPRETLSERELHRQRVARATGSGGKISEENASIRSEDSLAREVREQILQAVRDHRSMSLMTDEELRDASSVIETSAEPESTKPELPAPFSLSKPVEAGSSEMDLPEPILVAQSNTAASLRVEDADALRISGDVVDAALTYLEVMDDHPRTPESVYSYERLNEFSQKAIAGEYSPAQIQEFQSRVPTWAECKSAESKYILLGFSYTKASAAKAAGDTRGARALNSQTKAIAWRFMREHPNHPLQAYAVNHLLDAAFEMGLTEYANVREELEAYAADSPRSWATWNVSAYLAWNGAPSGGRCCE